VVPMGTITWNVTGEASAVVDVDVYSANDPDVPRRVDRFSAHGATARFTTLAMLLASDGRLRVSPVTPHLVLAQYYAWYDIPPWRDPQMLDRPVTPYASDDPAVVLRQAQQAHAAGIDAFVVSWQGKAIDWNDRRFRLLLDAAKAANMRASVFVESPDVNPAH